MNPKPPRSSKSSLTDVDQRIVTVRDCAVLLDSDLADLYDVSLGALMQAVRRNPDRFPADFMFALTARESAELRAQMPSTESRRGGRRTRLLAFTEQGVAMVSSVLRSDTAVRINIEIMRAFVRVRRAGLVSAEVIKLVDSLSQRVDTHDSAIAELVEAIRRIVGPPPRHASRPIGFTADLDSK